MTYSITLWLAFCLAVGTVCWFGTRGQAIAFTIVLALLLPGTLLPLGHAAPWKPAPGHYTVLGARIDVDEAIYVLLDDGGTPRLYKLPYTQQSANGLQRAMDMAEGNGGKVGYFGPKPPADGVTHHYHFQVFALDRKLDLPSGYNRQALLDKMRGHVLAKGQIIGTYKRDAF